MEDTYPVCLGSQLSVPSLEYRLATPVTGDCRKAPEKGSGWAIIPETMRSVKLAKSNATKLKEASRVSTNTLWYLRSKGFPSSCIRMWGIFNFCWVRTTPGYTFKFRISISRAGSGFEKAGVTSPVEFEISSKYTVVMSISLLGSVCSCVGESTDNTLAVSTLAVPTGPAGTSTFCF